MVLPNTTNYQLDFYTGDTCWRGELNYTSARRLTELMNDPGRDYIELERASLVAWDERLPHTVDTFGTISVNKKKTTVVFCHSSPAEIPQKTPERVSKVAQRVAVYMPPLVIVGNLHTVLGGDLINVVDLAHQDFLPLTNAKVLRIDSKAPLATVRGLALISREAIAAIQPVPEDAESETAAAVSSNNSRMAAIAYKLLEPIPV